MSSAVVTCTAAPVAQDPGRPSVPVAVLGRMPDRELIGLVAENDRDATAVWFLRHYPSTLSYATALARDDAVAEDLTAEAFLKVLQRILGGLRPDSVAAYLGSVVRNAWVDELRRGRFVDFHAVAEREQPVPADGVEHDFVTRIADRELMRDALDGLSPRHRSVLWWTAVEGQTLGVVAERLGITANAAAAVVFRARQALRRALERQQDGAQRTAVVRAQAR